MTAIHPEAAPEHHVFEADVSRLLHMMVHSVYSDKDVFLRELVSNAADACEKLRYEAIAAPQLLAGDPVTKIRVALDEAAMTLTIEDNGIGMSHDELVEALGTIARSGTRAFGGACPSARAGSRACRAGTVGNAAGQISHAVRRRDLRRPRRGRRAFPLWRGGPLHVRVRSSPGPSGS